MIVEVFIDPAGIYELAIIHLLCHVSEIRVEQDVDIGMRQHALEHRRVAISRHLLKLIVEVTIVIVGTNGDASRYGGVDVVLDMVGGEYFAKNLDALRTKGRIVYIASLGGTEINVPIFRVMQKRAVITGSTLRPRDADEKARLAAQVEAHVWPWIADGRFRPVMDRSFPLAEAGAAHAWLEAGGHVGKVTLLVEDAA